MKFILPILLSLLFENLLLYSSEPNFKNINVLEKGQEYYYNRNSIKDFEVIDGTIIALTSSGNILVFDSDLKLIAEITDSVEFTCLGSPIGKKFLFGRDDGAIFSIDADSLNMKLEAKINYAPIFITNISDSPKKNTDIFVVYYIPLTWYFDEVEHIEKTIGGKTIFYNITKNISDTLNVKNINNSVYPPNTFFCDNINSIYFNKEQCKDGSYFGFYNCRNRTFSFRDTTNCEIIKIMKTEKGKILAFGGFSHYNMHCNFIKELNGLSDTVYFKNEYYALYFLQKNEKNKDSIKIQEIPKYPIISIIDDTTNKKYIVFSGYDILKVGYNFQNWEKIYELNKLNFFSNGNDLGYFPNVSKAILTYPNKIICSTLNYGFLVIKNDSINNYLMDNQPEADNIDDIIINEKQIFFDSQWDKFPFKYINKKFVTIDPYPEDYLGHLHICPCKLFFYKNNLSSICESCFSRKRTVISNIINENAKKVFIDSIKDAFPGYIFSTNDNIWYFDNDSNLIFVLKNNNWFKLGQIEGFSQLPGSNKGSFFRVINTTGPPWLLRDGFYYLFFMNYTPDFSTFECKVKPFILKDTLKIINGTQFFNDIILLTDSGLLSYNIIKDTLKELEIKIPYESIQYIETDAAERLWLAGDGLWRYDFKSRELKKISVIGNHTIDAISKNPNSKGIVVAVRGRGLYFIE